MTDKKKKDQESDIESTIEDEGIENELVDEEASMNDKLKQLRTKLRECEQEKQAHLEELQRAKAEYLNSRKRLEAERARDVERAENAFIERLLPLCDSFRMAMQNEAVWQNVDETWRTGVESINAQLQSLLTSYDVTAIDPTGQPFDPQLHEAVSSTKSEDGVVADTVIEVLQFGYERNGTLIRPAKVIISS